MRRLILTGVVASLACAQSVSVLTQDQVRDLETKVAQHPEDFHSQKLLGQNYAAFILGVTSFGQYNTVTAVDAAKAGSSFAQHARDVLTTSSLAGVLAEGARPFGVSVFRCRVTRFSTRYTTRYRT